MADFKELITTITGAVDKFNSQIPGIQQKMLQDVLALTRELDVKDGKIKVAASNMRVLAKLRMQLQKVLLNNSYANGVRQYVQAFDKVTRLQNDYFASVESDFKAPKLAKEIKAQAIGSVVNSLTETGLNANIVDKVHDLMRQASTSGGSVATLSKQLTDFITNNESGEGQLLKYTKQITTDALNQFSGQYSQIVSADLGFEWYRYSGSNLETSRPFCLACTERKYFHISELPKILRGEFPEFIKYDGRINKKTELPEGMIPGTDASNFMINRGGYNCGHQWRPVSEDLVPVELQRALYETAEYKAWAIAHGKETPQLPPAPKPATESAPAAERDPLDIATLPKIEVKAARPVQNIYDVQDLFRKNKADLKEWFHNTEFKSFRIETDEKNNASTDKNGTIWLSREKSRLITEAFAGIQKGHVLGIDHEMALATLWHEIWHNTNKASGPSFLTDRQKMYMELGNEFVARKTLDRFMEGIGTRLVNETLKSDRTDTGYNSWVKNYDHLIKAFGADQQKVLEYMKDKMRNGDYASVKTYLVEALKSAIEPGKVPESTIVIGVQDAIKWGHNSFTKMY